MIRLKICIGVCRGEYWCCPSSRREAYYLLRGFHSHSASKSLFRRLLSARGFLEVVFDDLRAEKSSGRCATVSRELDRLQQKRYKFNKNTTISNKHHALPTPHQTTASSSSSSASSSSSSPSRRSSRRVFFRCPVFRGLRMTTRLPNDAGMAKPLSKSSCHIWTHVLATPL